MTLLEDEHDDPERGRERDQVEDRGLDRQHDRPERTGEQDQREDHDEREHVREVPVDRVDEVAVDGWRAAERRGRARRVRRWRDRRRPGCSTRRRRSPGTPRRSSTARFASRARPARSRRRCRPRCRRFAAIAFGSPPFATRIWNGFITPGEMFGVGEHLPTGDRGSGSREVLQLRTRSGSAACRYPRGSRRSRGRWPRRSRAGG